MKNRNKKRNDMKKTRLFLAVLFGIVLGMTFIMGNSKTASYSEVAYKTVHVYSGDTLWEIAKVELANNDYYTNCDVRHVVKDIRDINKLDSSNLYPGQELIVPSY